MKIVRNRPTPDAAATDSTRRTGKDGAVRQGAGVTPSGTTDRVELSGDAALRLVALKAANEAPAIRTELVDRMRHKLNAGKVGNDSVTLADAMIDDLDGLLQSEVSLELALKTMKVPASLAPEDRAAIRGQVEATRQALLRCLRLGNALLDVVRRTLEAQGRTTGYGRPDATAAAYGPRSLNTTG